MEIGKTIKTLRINKQITQQGLADDLNTSLQTISRWENDVNYPDIAMLVELAKYFHVTTDFLLGIENHKIEAKLLQTTEEFQVNTMEVAKNLIENFQNAAFPKLVSYEITERKHDILLIVRKEFGQQFDEMMF